MWDGRLRMRFAKDEYAQGPTHEIPLDLTPVLKQAAVVAPPLPRQACRGWREERGLT